VNAAPFDVFLSADKEFRDKLNAKARHSPVVRSPMRLGVCSGLIGNGEGVSPFYRWQKNFFENGAAAFEQKRPTNHSADQERIAYLQKKIQTKDELLAELMAEHVALKKEIGEL
jgi:hypothetical protein